MTLPFTLRIATQDWHPKDHISFASTHPPPNNKPFESKVTVANPKNESETEEISLWPDHCIRNTKGAELIPEFDVSKIDHIIKKGQNNKVEMLSAFKDTYRKPCVADSGLSNMLKEVNATHVYIVGLAMDFCVKWTAIDSAKEGWHTFIVTEGTKGVDQSEEGLKKLTQELEEHGVKIVSTDSDEVGWIKKGGKT